MEFKDKSNYFAFKLLILIVLFGMYTYILMFNYMDIPKTYEIENYTYGSGSPVLQDYVKKDFIITVDFSDKMLSNGESIIVWICLLWGFMRFFDLSVFLENYNNDNEDIVN